MIRSEQLLKEAREQDHTCEFCYYELFDDKAYPCSRCVCNQPTENMWRARKDELLEDGTLIVTVDDATKVGRVLVQDDQKRGGLYYADKPRLSNREWKEFLAQKFNISKTSAKEMLHGMMRWKMEDNLKRTFNPRKDEPHERSE